MKKTVCELFAGVGGFRCGLNGVKTLQDAQRAEPWETVWFNQWEPDKKHQWAHDCYVNHFGTVLDLNGRDTTNVDIAAVDKAAIPDHSLLVGGFPCQDYSVARSLSGEKGIEGKKGVLWWSIHSLIQVKKPPFILLENVDRLLKSPSKQRGRDFGVILSCLAEDGYIVEWRVVNAADYGSVQRRKRTFIFAYRKETAFARSVMEEIGCDRTSGVPRINGAKAMIESIGFFARAFPVLPLEKEQTVDMTTLNEDIVQVSNKFAFDFQNSGFMVNGSIFTIKTKAQGCAPKLLGDILEAGKAPDKYFIPEDKLYYTDPAVNHSDETAEELPKESRQTWQYIKGGKRKPRTAASGYAYVYTEGPVPLVDEWNLPARTMLTSEGSFNRCSHLVRDKETREIRVLTPVEAERIQGFPDNWTQECMVNGKITPMPERMRYFCMGNALVVSLIRQMEAVLSRIIEAE